MDAEGEWEENVVPVDIEHDTIGSDPMPTPWRNVENNTLSLLKPPKLLTHQHPQLKYPDIVIDIFSWPLISFSLLY